MDSILLSLVAGAAAGLLTLLTEYLYSTFKKGVEVKIGQMTIKLSNDNEEALRQISERILELQTNPQVFVSYSFRDKDFVQHLIQDLHTHGVKVWSAGEQIQVGDSIAGKLKEGIASSQWAILVLSDNFAQSDYAAKELDLVIQEERSRNRKFVLPVLYQGGKLPAQLTDRAFADFQVDYTTGLNSLLSALHKS